jgi:hypothetical protein
VTIQEQAVMWCAVMASNPYAYEQIPVYEIHDSLDICQQADELACAAYCHAKAMLVGHPYQAIQTPEALIIYAEAEALLRCGWEP